MNEEVKEFRKITRFIEGVTFKKKIIGGINIEDVYSRMQDLNEMYQECVRNIKQACNTEAIELREELARVRNKNQEYNEKSELLTKTITTVHKNSDVMLLQAEREAGQIKEKAIKEVERIAERQNEKVSIQRMKAQKILDELTTIKEESVSNLNVIAGDLSHLANQIEHLHDKMVDIPDTPQKIFTSDTLNLKKVSQYESDLA